MSSLSPWEWIGAPFLLCVVWTILFAIPLRVFGLQLPEPVFALWPVFAWAMIRPSILAPLAVLALGYFLDIFWGGPQGLWALSLLIAYGTVLAARSLMIGQGAAAMFAWFLVVAALALGAATMITIVKVAAAPNPVALAWQFVATIVLYPFSQRLIDRFEDADVRFR